MWPQIQLFRVLTAISITLSIIPLFWHWTNKNVPAVLLTVWVVISNICLFMNTFIWPNDYLWETWDGNIYCDIQIKILIACGTGQMGAVAAISRNLANIMSDDISVVQTKRVRRQNLIKDLILCLGIPIYMMSIHYIVQPARYGVYAIVGCMPMVDRSWPSIVLLFIWPPIAALVAAYFSALVIFRLHRYRTRFATAISSDSSVSRSRFVRLFVLSLILIVVYLPMSFYLLKVNLSYDRIPYSWKLVHGIEWTYIQKFPTFGVVKFDCWFPAATGIALFLFFGLGSDAVGMYRQWLRAAKLDRYLPDRVMGITHLAPLTSVGDSGWDSTHGSSNRTQTDSWKDDEDYEGGMDSPGVTTDTTSDKEPDSSGLESPEPALLKTEQMGAGHEMDFMGRSTETRFASHVSSPSESPVTGEGVTVTTEFSVDRDEEDLEKGVHAR